MSSNNTDNTKNQSKFIEYLYSKFKFAILAKIKRNPVKSASAARMYKYTPMTAIQENIDEVIDETKRLFEEKYKGIEFDCYNSDSGGQKIKSCEKAGKYIEFTSKFTLHFGIHDEINCISLCRDFSSEDMVVQMPLPHQGDFKIDNYTLSNFAKNVGSMKTYLNRYNVRSFLGVSTGEEDMEESIAKNSYQDELNKKTKALQTKNQNTIQKPPFNPTIKPKSAQEKYEAHSGSP